MFLEDLTMLGFDNDSSNSTKKASPNEESNGSCNDVSANEAAQVRKWRKS